VSGSHSSRDLPTSRAALPISAWPSSSSSRRRAAAVELLFARFAGDWEVLEDEYNRAALGFWRRVISRHTAGRYAETREAGEVCHRFRTGPRSAGGAR
jgi:hypothetical protein